MSSQNLDNTNMQAVTCTAFSDHTIVASGTPQAVAVAIKRRNATDGGTILVFNDNDSQAVELDLRGTLEDVEKRYEQTPIVEATTDARGPGRPKLGVVAREITLLPRHWQWLAAQPGGASVAIRKLVEAASKAGMAKDIERTCRENSYRFMSAMAGNLVNFEEATRALFSGDKAKFEREIEPWPEDIKSHLRKIGSAAFEVTVQ